MQTFLLTKSSISLWQKTKEIRDKRNMSQQSKDFIWQVYSQHYTKWGKTQSISTTNRNKTRVSPPLFNIVLKVLAQSKRLVGYKRDTNKAKNKSSPLNCGWHNSVYKRIWRLNQTLTADRYFQQGNRPQNEHENQQPPHIPKINMPRMTLMNNPLRNGLQNMTWDKPNQQN